MNGSHKTKFTFAKNQGAFLVIALILLIVLSAMALASMAMTISSLRVSRNFSRYDEAKIKATTMAAYAYRIISSYEEGRFPGPATCNSVATCNGINTGFPHNGRPTLVWTSGISESDISGLQTDAWWTEHGFSFEGDFSGSGNARVIVLRIGQQTTYPYNNTYKIVGYGTDSSGTARATSTLYYSWLGFRPDPGNGTCSGGCQYGQCCSSGTCVISSSGCASSTATFVPAGWYCADYFVTGLEYNASTCANTTAAISDGVEYWSSTYESVQDYYLANNIFPTSITMLSTTINNQYTGGGGNNILPSNPYTVNNALYNSTDLTKYMYIQFYMEDSYTYITPQPTESIPGKRVFRSAIYVDGSGNFIFLCGPQVPSGDNNDLTVSALPEHCTCTDMGGTWAGNGCIP